MKKFITAFMVAVMVLFVSACSRETVPPASLGKVLSASGYSVDVKEPGKYWLAWWNDMVILDTSTQTVSERITVKMADNLDLSFVVRFRTRIAGNEKTINTMFSDIKHDNYKVDLQKVYSVYGKDVIQSASRSVVGKYRAEEVPQNFDKITQELHKLVTERLANSPLEVSNVTLADVVYPDVITKAIEAQAERRLAIETEENIRAVEMVKKTNELSLAKADYEIRVTRANALKAENEITAKGLSPLLLEYRRLDVMEKMADNHNTVFYPFEASGSSGLSNRIFSK